MERKGQAPPRPRTPDPTNVWKNPEEREKARFVQDVLRILVDELDRRTADDVTRHQLLLSDPTGAVWALTIDDTGTLVTTKLRG